MKFANVRNLTMRDSILKALKFRFNVVVMTMFVMCPISVISQNFVEIKKINLFCEGCSFATIEPCSIKLQPLSTPQICDLAFPTLLNATTAQAKLGKFGPDLEFYPTKPFQILSAYRGDLTDEAKYELSTLLLMSHEGQKIISANPWIVVEANQINMDLVPSWLLKRLQAYLLKEFINNPQSINNALLDNYLHSGLLADPFELLDEIQKDQSASDNAAAAELARAIFPYSPRASYNLGFLALANVACSLENFKMCLAILADSLTEEVSLQSRIWKRLHENRFPELSNIPLEDRWQLFQIMNRLPSTLQTPDTLDDLLNLFKSIPLSKVSVENICSMQSSLLPLITRDSELKNYHSSICKPGFNTFPIFALAVAIFATTALLFGRVKSESYVKLQKCSTKQRIHLSELNRCEREELMNYFGLGSFDNILELNRSFRRLAKTFHPDSFTGNETIYIELRKKYERAKCLIESAN